MLFEVLTGEKLHFDNLTEAEQQLRAVNPAIPDKILEIINNIFRLQVYGKFQSAAELHREFLAFDSANSDSGVLIKTEFLGRSGKNNAAEYSIDFSQDESKFVKTALHKIRKKARNENKASADAPFNWKLAQKNLLVGGAGILAIVVLHFFFQFSFLKDDSVQMVKELTETGQIAEVAPLIESEPPIIEVETADEIDPFINHSAEKPAGSAMNYEERAETKTKKTEIVRKPPVISPPVQSRIKTAPQRSTTKKKEPQETRAERLRRAEKMLTGA